MYPLAISALLAPLPVLAAPAALPASAVEQQLIDTIDLYYGYCTLMRDLGSGRFSPDEELTMMSELAAEAEAVVKRRQKLSSKEKDALVRLNAQPVIAHMLEQMRQTSRALSYDFADSEPRTDAPYLIAHTKAAKALNRLGLLILHVDMK